MSHGGRVGGGGEAVTQPTLPTYLLEKVISGGQTGADRTALEIARALGIPTGGWVPRGWWTDEGQDPSLAVFGCEEHASYEYAPRTQANVADSDGTVWFGHTSPGYWCTKKAIRGEHWLENPTDPEALVYWLVCNDIRVLNVAGNRVRMNPLIVAQVRGILGTALQELKDAGRVAQVGR